MWPEGTKLWKKLSDNVTPVKVKVFSLVAGNSKHPKAIDTTLSNMNNEKLSVLVSFKIYCFKKLRSLIKIGRIRVDLE